VTSDRCSPHRCSEKFFNKLLGRTDIEDALGRLDKLTQEEIQMVAAQSLKATHGVQVGVTSKVQAVGNQVQVVDERVKAVGEQVNRVLNSAQTPLN
jgi:hypothetical protein